MEALSTLNPVVVLDITHAGYGILRSLYQYKIPLYGFTYDTKHIEVKTALAKEIVIYNSLEDLLNKLIVLAKNLKLKPVLILTNDDKVEFVIAKRDEIEKYYTINIPPSEIIEQLIDKIKLHSIINELNIKIPKTINIENKQDGSRVKNLQFPIIIKPFLKSDKWNRAGFSKAMIINNTGEFASKFPKIFQVENRIIAQEYIPGGDEFIYYCLVYYNQNGKCLQHFTGQKIRQWAPLTGTSSATKPVFEPYVTNETIRIFDAISYNGYGSMEFKKHQLTGDFYMIEPTAGRVDAIEYIATSAGINLPLIGYCDMTGHTIRQIEKPNNKVVYLDEVNEMLSFFEYNTKHELTISQWLTSVKGKKYFRYLSTSDLKISLRILYLLTRRITGYFIRKALKVKRD